MAAARGDGLHKLTTALADGYDTVVVEDLDVAGMTVSAKGSGRRAKAGLNRAIPDASPAELRRQLAYKRAWYGSPWWWPTGGTRRRRRARPAGGESQACPWPSAPSPARTRAVPNHAGIDRDLNAAMNLAARVRATTGTGSGPGTGRGDLANGRGDGSFLGSPGCSFDEPSRRHRHSAEQDRHRRPATGGSGARSCRK